MNDSDPKKRKNPHGLPDDVGLPRPDEIRRVPGSEIDTPGHGQGGAQLPLPSEGVPEELPRPTPNEIERPERD